MIPVFTLERQNKIIGRELQQAIKEVVDSGNYILGAKIAEFENAFARYLDIKYAIGVASGSDALSLALLAQGVKTGDEVILPANCYPSVFAVSAIGAIPRLVDIDPLTFNIDPSKIHKALSEKTKAIIAVHLYGQPADMKQILAIGEKYSLPVIEDCAQAHGAEIKMQKSIKLPKSLRSLKERTDWKKAGTIGDVGCFSFYPTKNLGCFGDGGMVVTDNAEIARKVRLLRMYGEEARYKSILLGRNSRLDELQAAILLVKLQYLDKWNERRRNIASLYKSQIILPKETSLARYVYHLFVIRTERRDELKIYLEKQGIQTAIHYPKPIHMQPSFKFLGYKKGDFPESEKSCREVLSLPMFPELKDEEVEKVADAIKKYFKES